MFVKFNAAGIGDTDIVDGNVIPIGVDVNAADAAIAAAAAAENGNGGGVVRPAPLSSFFMSEIGDVIAADIAMVAANLAGSMRVMSLCIRSMCRPMCIFCFALYGQNGH